MADEDKTNSPEDADKAKVVSEDEQPKPKDVKIYKKVQRTGRSGG